MVREDQERSDEFRSGQTRVVRKVRCGHTRSEKVGKVSQGQTWSVKVRHGESRSCVVRQGQACQAWSGVVREGQV